MRYVIPVLLLLSAFALSPRASALCQEADIRLDSLERAVYTLSIDSMESLSLMPLPLSALDSVALDYKPRLSSAVVPVLLMGGVP